MWAGAEGMDLLRQVDVPVGEDGRYCVERFEVSQQDSELERIRAIASVYSGGGCRPVPAGTYSRLMRGGVVVMSDTPAERRDHFEPVRRAEGRVFIAGLGLGMVLQAVLDKSEVQHVTVVELSEEVIRLVGSHYQERYGDRLDIQQGDAYAWTPPKGTHLRLFDVAWFDIWDDLCSDNLPLMTKIKRRWVRWAKWRGFWGEHETRAYLARRGW